MKIFFNMIVTLNSDKRGCLTLTSVFEEHGYFGIVSTTSPASTEPLKLIQKRRYLMFIGEVYWKLIYLLNYKCFIIAVCMVLCGNICFSGFYSDDLQVQGAELG